MERKDFFSAFGITAGMLFMAPAISSCSKSMTDSASGTNTNNNTNGTTGSGVDFTLDLTKSPYTALNNNGGSVIANNILVARTAAGSLVALSAICTHQGATLDFDSANNRLHCSNHGSNFATDGSVLNGPALTALKKYNTQLTGSSLRVYA